LNPRQRRGVLLMILAIVGALVVFASVSSYVSEVRAKVGDEILVMQTTTPLKANRPVPDGVIEEVSVPRKWVSAATLPIGFDFTALVPATDIPAGAYLQEGMFKQEPSLAGKQREIAISVNAETGVAGKVGPGVYVDVVATFAPELEGGQACAAIVVPEALVIERGFERTAPANQEGFPAQDVVPVTLALEPPWVKRLMLAQSFAEEVHLAIINPTEVGSPLRESTDCGPSALKKEVKVPASDVPESES
jgi:pilus assembly protein CpaB